MSGKKTLEDYWGDTEPEKRTSGWVRLLVAVPILAVGAGIMLPYFVPGRTCGAPQSARLEHERREAAIDAFIEEADAAAEDHGDVESF